jgi:hypothetical protein
LFDAALRRRPCAGEVLTVSAPGGLVSGTETRDGANTSDAAERLPIAPAPPRALQSATDRYANMEVNDLLQRIR